MIELPRSRRGNGQEERSQVLLEICLNLYALIAAAVLARALLLILGVDRRVWIGAVTYRATGLLVKPLAMLPGAGTRMIGNATLADCTLVALAVLVPLGILVRGNGRRAERLHL